MAGIPLKEGRPLWVSVEGSPGYPRAASRVYYIQQHGVAGKVGEVVRVPQMEEDH